MSLTRLLPAVLLCLLALSATASAAPKACAPDQLAFKTRAGSVCAKPGAASAGARIDSGAVSAWMKLAARPARGTKLPKKLRKAPTRLAKLAGNLLAQPIAPRARAAASRAPILERKQLPTKTEVKDGVTYEASGEIRYHADDTLSEFLELKAKVGKFTLRYRPVTELDDGEKIGCPTADGSVSTTFKMNVGGTQIVSKGGRVLESKTVTVAGDVKSRGRVGRDARLERVDSDITLATSVYRRGWQETVTVNAGFTAGREGSPQTTRPMTGDLRLRVAGASAAEERAYEQAAAKQIAAMSELTAKLGQIEGQGRTKLRDAETTWYDLPNDCASADLDPNDVDLVPGASKPVSGRVIAKNGGGEAEATFTVDSVDPGAFTVDRADADPGAPATFTAKGGKRTDEAYTVLAGGTATSRAGRARFNFDARHEEPEFPKTFIGAVGADTVDQPGATHNWDGNATWTLKSVDSFPDGSKTAWYDMTEADVWWAESHLGGPGCHYYAKGSGGEIQSGDVELRILPDGKRVYAFLYDVSVDVTYTGKDCPPGSEPPPMDGTIPARLNTRIPGQPGDKVFRPAGDGWKLEGTKLTDIQQPPFGSSVGTWTIEPGV